MAEEPENLTLRYLRRIDERTTRIEETQIEHGERLTTIERMLASLRREQALDAEARAALETRDADRPPGCRNQSHQTTPRPLRRATTARLTAAACSASRGVGQVSEA